ncbi:MAG: formyltransferase family protein [Pirellulaceae bacterium]
MNRVVLFTSQDIGFQLAEFFASREDLATLVVAQHTPRDRIYGYRSAIDVCRASRMPFIEAGRVTDDIRRQTEEWRPDLIVSAYYPHIIPPSILGVPRLGCINIHPGILPDYRGRFPTPWYILNGESHFGIAIHHLTNGVDTGDVLVQRKYPLNGETGHELYRRTMHLGAELLVEHFDRIIAGDIQAAEQRAGGSYFRTIERRYEIDWNLSRESISRRVRVHGEPYFPAYTFLFNKMILISRTRSVEIEGYTPQGGGEIVKTWPDGRFAVSCNDGCLLIEEYTVCPPLRSEEERQLHISAGNRLG